MKHYKFPEHSMIVKSADYMDKVNQIKTLQQENEQLKSLLSQTLDTLAAIRDLFEAGPTRAMINRTIAKILVEVKE